jgi:hypothetical protein
MHLLHKRFMKNYQCWYAHEEVFVSKRRMEERVVGSTSSISNVYEAANDNTVNEKNLMQMQLRFFYLLKDSNELL